MACDQGRALVVFPMHEMQMMSSAGLCALVCSLCACGAAGVHEAGAHVSQPTWGGGHCVLHLLLSPHVLLSLSPSQQVPFSRTPVPRTQPRASTPPTLLRSTQQNGSWHAGVRQPPGQHDPPFGGVPAMLGGSCAAVQGGRAQVRRVGQPAHGHGPRTHAHTLRQHAKPLSAAASAW